LIVANDKERECHKMNKFYIESHGCASNRVDTARVQSFLTKNGWTEIHNPTVADVLVLMTCGFSQFHEHQMLKRLVELKAAKKPNARIWVGGCLPEISPDNLKTVFQGNSFGPRSLDKLERLVNSDVNISDIPATWYDHQQGVCNIRVSTGCMNRCTFCAIPFANGKTMSRSIREICDDIKGGIDEGIKHFKLTSEDVSAYGLDVGSNIVELIETIHETCFGDYTITFDTLNPRWFHRYLLDRLDLFATDTVVGPLYVPIQSGSDKILRLMKRGYTKSKVWEVLLAIQSELPHLSVSTDFIVGFPSETDDDFEETVDMVSRYHFGFLEVFQYQDRPGTPALRIEPKVSKVVKERRAGRLTSVFLNDFLDREGLTDDPADFMKFLEEVEELPVNINMLLETVSLPPIVHTTPTS
jgi:threonylcarbamoyladenosine tRNA methylthiotransferase CDKAL1